MFTDSERLNFHYTNRFDPSLNNAGHIIGKLNSSTQNPMALAVFLVYSSSSSSSFRGMFVPKYARSIVPKNEF